MRTDSTHSNASTEHYRKQAETCRQMAEAAISPYREDWLRLAEKWAKLAEGADEHQSTPLEVLNRALSA